MLYGDINTEEDMANWCVIYSGVPQGEPTCLLRPSISLQESGWGNSLFEHHANDRGLEVGGTWYGPEFQRTAVNTEMQVSYDPTCF